MQLAVTCLRHQVSLELLLQHECQSVRDCSLFCSFSGYHIAYAYYKL